VNRATARRTIVLAMALGLVVRLLNLLAIQQSTVPKWHHVEPDLDSSVTLQWAADIQKGNVLGNPPFHPLTRWMRLFGNKEDWVRWRGDPLVFQQAPLYTYLVAALVKTPDGTQVYALLLQTLLTILAIPAVSLLAFRWFGERAAIIAALLFAMMQTSVALDALLLRDSLGISLLALGLVALEEVRYRSRPMAMSALSGVLLGLAALVRENLILIAIAAIPLSWLLGERRSGDAAPVKPALKPSRVSYGRLPIALAGALLLTTSPVWLRNAIVGAPLFTLSNRGPETVFLGLFPDKNADPLGFNYFPRLKELMEQAGKSTLATLSRIGREAQMEPVRMARLSAIKIWALLSPLEPSDNFDLTYLLHISPVLWFCVPTGALTAVFLIGLGRALAQANRCFTALISMGLLFCALFLVSVLWRLRAGALPVAIPLMAGGIDWCIGCVVNAYHGQRIREALVPVMAVLLTAGTYVFPPKPLFRFRLLDASLAARVHEANHNYQEAINDMDEYFELALQGKTEERPAAFWFQYRESLVQRRNEQAQAQSTTSDR
jgi:hypothetical protein